MRKILFAIISGICFFSVSAQKAKRYIIQPGENMVNMIPVTEMYQYPQFQKGFVYFKDGTKSVAPLNYNLLQEEFYFIDPKGDTLTLINPEEVRSVMIGNDQFYYSNKRFLKLDTVIGDVELLNATFFTTLNKKKVGAYGTTTEEGTAFSSYFVMPNESKLDLIPQVVTTVACRQSLFLSRKFDQFRIVTRSNLFLVYDKKKELLKSYLKNNKVNLSSRQDVLNLVLFMNTH